MAVDGIGSTGSSTASLTGSRGIADNFDTFLQLLTTQLKNQNPLDPLDTNQFTQQLVQFTGVEQQLKTNEFLEALLLNTQTSYRADAVSYIGKEVTAAGSATRLQDGQATWSYELATDAAIARLEILDSTGA